MTEGWVSELFVFVSQHSCMVDFLVGLLAGGEGETV